MKKLILFVLILNLVFPFELLARGSSGSVSRSSSSSRPSSSPSRSSSSNYSRPSSSPKPSYSPSRSSSSSSSSSRSSSSSSKSSSSKQSSSSSSGSGGGTSSKPSSPAKSSSQSTSDSGWGTSRADRVKSQTPAPKPSATDAALASKVKQVDTAKTRTEAVNRFNEKPAQTKTFSQADQEDFNKTYSNNDYQSRFDTEPVARPVYIRPRVYVDSYYYDVYYNPVYRSYGYMGPLGWIYYDSIAHRHFVETNNYVNTEPVYVDNTSHSSGSGFGMFLLAILGFIAIIVLILILIAVFGRKKEEEQTRDEYRPREEYRPQSTYRPYVRKEQSEEKPVKSKGNRKEDPKNLEFWEALEPGSIVYLTDEQAMEDLGRLQGEGKIRASVTRGLEHEVVRIMRFTQQDNLCTWFLLELQGPEQVLYMMVKIVDGRISYGMFFDQEGFERGTRQELLDRDFKWMFQAPETENFQACDLKFTDSIKQDQNEGGPVIYLQKDQGALYADLVQSPAQSGIKQPQFSMVVEYQTDQEVDNTQMVILEIGGVDESGNKLSQGGEVWLLCGTSIKVQDFDFDFEGTKE